MTLEEYIKIYTDLGWIIVPEGASEKDQNGKLIKFKKPIGKWSHFNDGATAPTYEEVMSNIQKARTQEPIFGIGVICGKVSGVVVIDEDSYKKEPDEKKKSKIKNILEKAVTPVSKTGGGGKHYFFKYTDRVHSSVDASIAIDVRAQGSNIVLPPSRHDSGGVYEWIVSPTEVPLAEIPEELIELLKKPVVKGNSSLFDNSKYYDHGERDSGMTSAAMSFVSVYPQHRWERDAWAQYKNWAKVQVNNDDGYVTEELLRGKFESAISKLKNPTGSSVKELLGDLDVIDSLFDPGRISGIPTGYIYFDDMTGGILSGVLTLVASQTGVGKSLVYMNILDNILKRGVPVAYLDLENGKPEVLERILRIRYGLSKDFYSDQGNRNKIKDMATGFDNYLYYSKESGVREPKRLYEVMNEAISKGAKIIVVDPLQKIKGGDDIKEQGAIVGELSDFAQKNKVAVLLCHHVKKTNNSGGKYSEDIDGAKKQYLIPSIEDIKGGSIITDTAEVVWVLMRKFAEKGETREEMWLKRSQLLLRIEKCRGRGDAIGDYVFYLDMNTLQLKEHESELSFYSKGLPLFNLKEVHK